MYRLISSGQSSDVLADFFLKVDELKSSAKIEK